MNQNKKTIFISYGRDTRYPQDIELVRKVKEDLSREGFEVLMDEEQLRTALDWEIRLENMISDSDWMLFFITPYSARRPDGYCLNELAMSLAYKKPIAPIMIKYIVPPLSICRLQYLDLQTLKDDDNYQKKLNEIISVVNEEKRLGFEGEHLRVLNELNPIKFETTIAKHIYGFTGREWVYREVDRWLNEEDNSRVLWIKGEAGFGKSAVATYLATTHPSAISVYFCQYDYRESKKAREMLKVLIYELSTQIDEYYKIMQTLNVKEILQNSAIDIFTQLLLEPLNKISLPKEKLFFVIDALDEGTHNGENQIVKLVSDRFSDLPSWINIVITSRPEPELIDKLKKFNPVELKTDDERNRNDLELFLKEQEKISDKKIVKALIKKCEGNILYLKSIFGLNMIKNDEISLENIEQLPDTMELFYLKYFERKFGDIELYEEKYIEFVSLLVAQGGIPELLLKDILKISERDYKIIKRSFGSLLEVDKDSLVFYHKSIYVWLSDYDKSGNYSADVEMGRRIYEEFINALTAKNYKIEYLEFNLLNENIINKIYEQEKSLERFFGLLRFVAEEETKIDALYNLGKKYFYNNRIHKAIELQEYSLKKIKKLYSSNSERWVKKYTLALYSLARSHYKEERVAKAIKLQKESLKILKELYGDNPERWVKDYTYTLGSLARSYLKDNRTTKAIKLQKKSLRIANELYKDNPERWVDDYTYTLVSLARVYLKDKKVAKAIKLQKESLKILKELYGENPKRWVKDYTYILGSLARSYLKDNRVAKAIKLREENLEIIKELYDSNSEIWSESYIMSLGSLSLPYSKNDRINEAIKLQEESLKIAKELYNSTPRRWAEIYIIALGTLSLSYSKNDRINKAIELQEESLRITKELYEENSRRWAKSYILALVSLSNSYSKNNRANETIAFINESLRIANELYRDNPKRWVNYYISFLDNLAGSCYKNNNVAKAIKLKKERLKIVKKLYRNNPQRWAMKYTSTLFSLAGLYDKNNNATEAIRLRKEGLKTLS